MENVNFSISQWKTNETPPLVVDELNGLFEIFVIFCLAQKILRSRFEKADVAKCILKNQDLLKLFIYSQFNNIFLISRIFKILLHYEKY